MTCTCVTNIIPLIVPTGANRKLITRTRRICWKRILLKTLIWLMFIFRPSSMLCEIHFIDENHPTCAVIWTKGPIKSTLWCVQWGATISGAPVGHILPYDVLKWNEMECKECKLYNIVALCLKSIFGLHYKRRYWGCIASIDCTFRIAHPRHQWGTVTTNWCTLYKTGVCVHNTHKGFGLTRTNCGGSNLKIV